MGPYTYLISLAVISVVVAAAEWLAPRRPDQPVFRKGLFWDVLHLIFNGHFLGVIFYGIAVQHLLPPFDAWLSSQDFHDIVYKGAAAEWPVWQQAIIALFAIDLMQWCVHNALHRVPFLWHSHQCHHSVSDGEMSWIVAFRFQWTEVVIYRVGLYVPMAWFGFSGEALMVHAVFGTAIGHLNHANLNLTYGPLRYLLNNPNMHLWHHDYEGTQTTTKNFGIIFSLWDWIFGTAYLPEHPPERIGFKGDEDFPKTFFAAQSWPFAKLLPKGQVGFASALGALLLGIGWYLH